MSSLAGHAFANVAITPTWDSINANTADSAGIEWDVWWGSPDITQACYQFDGQDLGCVTTISESTAAVNADTDGSYLAVTSGEDSKGYMPVVFPAAGVGTYPAQIELHDAFGVVSTHAFDMTFIIEAVPITPAAPLPAGYSQIPSTAAVAPQIKKNRC